jgi:hypothetical protein
VLHGGLFGAGIVGHVLDGIGQAELEGQVGAGDVRGRVEGTAPL